MWLSSCFEKSIIDKLNFLSLLHLSPTVRAVTYFIWSCGYGNFKQRNKTTPSERYNVMRKLKVSSSEKSSSPLTGNPILLSICKYMYFHVKNG